MVNFGFKDRSNHSLSAYNQLNRHFYAQSSFLSGRTYQKNFLTSGTSLTREEYGETPRIYAERIGIEPGDWEQEGSIYILRAAVMTQFLRERTTFESYWQDICGEFEKILAKAN